MNWVRPTSRGWVFGTAGILWVLTAVVNHMLFPFVLGCAAIALTVASFVGAWLSLRGVTVKRGASSDAATGQAVALPLVVTNTKRRRRQPIAVLEEVPFAAAPLSRAVVPPLAPGEKHVVRRRLLAMRRGDHRLNTLTLRSGDPAGLFYRQTRLSLPARVLVLPGSEPLPDLVLEPREAAGAVDGSPVSAVGTSQEVYGVREYNPMDGMAHIHWKSSARFGRLMVREFERNAVISVAILVDAAEDAISGHEHWSNLEYQVRAAASLVQHCAALYCRMALGAGGERAVLMPPQLAAETESAALYELAVLTPGSVPVAEVALRLGEMLPRDTVVFCLSLSATEALASALRVLEGQSMVVKWYCASRPAFARAAGRTVGAATRPRRLSPQPADLNPGMPLPRAFADVV